MQWALESEDLWLVRSLPPEISSLLDALVVAVLEGGQGLILILEGAIGIDSLVQWVEGFGVSVVPETCRDYRGLSGDAFGFVALSLAVVDGPTTARDSSRRSGQRPPGCLLRCGSGVARGPNRCSAGHNMPLGLTTALFPDCAGLDTVAPNAELSGCNGEGLSAELMVEDTVARQCPG